MGTEIEGELRRLRERAYGPDADIHDDPDAIRRLEQIESQMAAEPSVAPSDEPVVVAADPARAAAAGVEPAGVQPAGAAIPADRNSGSIRRRRLLIAWTASIVAAVIATAGAAALLSSPSLQHDAVLAPLAAGESDVPAHLSAGSTVTVVEYAPFRGMRVFTGALEAQSCIAVLPPPSPEADPEGRDAFWRCSAPGLPPVIDGTSAPLGELDPAVTYPDVRFTLNGDRVFVDLSE